MSSSEVMISLTRKRSLRKAGMPIQQAPAMAAAANMSGRRIGSGPISKMATPVAAMQPSHIWPSTPMFQNLSFSATAEASPTRTKGVDAVTTWARPFRSRNT